MSLDDLPVSVVEILIHDDLVLTDRVIAFHGRRVWNWVGRL